MKEGMRACMVVAAIAAGLTIAGIGCDRAGGGRRMATVESPPPPTGTGTTPPAVVPSEKAVVDHGASDAISDEGPLVGEERERDPRSETVTIKVVVAERLKAHVFWGQKDFGEAPVEIVRPRSSGPLDLVVRAPGYLPLHARAFTDRDDKLVLRLYAEAEAPLLLGFRPDQETLQNKAQNGHAARASAPHEKK